ncbi:MAG: hypothetical protein ACLFV3_01480 [Phycisphaeraceae bacterium]
MSVDTRPPIGGPVKLSPEVTRRLDVVCPRTLASVHFGADTEVARPIWRRLVPERAAEATTPLPGAQRPGT